MRCEVGTVRIEAISDGVFTMTLSIIDVGVNEEGIRVRIL